MLIHADSRLCDGWCGESFERTPRSPHWPLASETAEFVISHGQLPTKWLGNHVKNQDIWFEAIAGLLEQRQPLYKSVARKRHERDCKL